MIGKFVLPPPRPALEIFVRVEEANHLSLSRAGVDSDERSRCIRDSRPFHSLTVGAGSRQADVLRPRRHPQLASSAARASADGGDFQVQARGG